MEIFSLDFVWLCLFLVTGESTTQMISGPARFRASLFVYMWFREDFLLVLLGACNHIIVHLSIYVYYSIGSIY